MNLSRQSKDALCDDEGALSQRTSVSNNLELKNCNFLVLDANLHSCYILPLPSSRTLTTMPCCIKLTFMSRQIEKHVLETWLVDTFTPQADGLYNPSKPGASSRQMVRHTGTHTACVEPVLHHRQLGSSGGQCSDQRHIGLYLKVLIFENLWKGISFYGIVLVQ